MASATLASTLEAVRVVLMPSGCPASASRARALATERVNGSTPESNPKAPRGIIAGTSVACPPRTASMSRGTSTAWLSAWRTRRSWSGPAVRVSRERYEVRIPVWWSRLTPV